MNEHRIVFESVLYDTVLPSGNMYTKRLIERIIKPFSKDEAFHDGMLCVLKSDSAKEYLDYSMTAGKIMNMRIDESEHRLVAELLMLDTLCGRMVSDSFRKGDTILVVPFGVADSIEVDGIHILSSENYELHYFEIVVVLNRQ